MKSICEITLYELMAEDLDVSVQKLRKGFKIEIDDENGENVVCETNIHPYAADSFAMFCKQYLASYERASKESDNV